MAVYLVTYDLNKVGQNYSGLYEEIKKYSWAKLSESSYVIETNKSVETVLSEMRKCLDSNDTIYIISLTQPWTGYGPKDVNEWIQTHLNRVFQY
jgi:hypothetical protein